MKYYTHNEVLDEVVGGKDTSERVEYDAKMQAYLVGEAIRAARIAQNLTQEEFGRMMGYKLPAYPRSSMARTLPSAPSSVLSRLWTFPSIWKLPVPPRFHSAECRYAKTMILGTPDQVLI